MAKNIKTRSQLQLKPVSEPQRPVLIPLYEAAKNYVEAVNKLEAAFNKIWEKVPLEEEMRAKLLNSYQETEDYWRLVDRMNHLRTILMAVGQNQANNIYKRKENWR